MCSIAYFKNIEPISNQPLFQLTSNQPSTPQYQDGPCLRIIGESDGQTPRPFALSTSIESGCSIEPEFLKIWK